MARPFKHGLTAPPVAPPPDGTLVATASNDDTVRPWNPTTRQPIGHPLTGHNDPVRAVAFSPDGALLATAGNWSRMPRAVSGRQWMQGGTRWRRVSIACCRVLGRHRPLLAAAQQSPACTASTFERLRPYWISQSGEAGRIFSPMRRSIPRRSSSAIQPSMSRSCRAACLHVNPLASPNGWSDPGRLAGRKMRGHFQRRATGRSRCCRAAYGAAPRVPVERADHHQHDKGDEGEDDDHGGGCSSWLVFWAIGAWPGRAGRSSWSGAAARR